jgi:hypothetical protein
MNDLVQVSVASYSSTLPRGLRCGEGRQIEGSWKRVGEWASLDPVPPIARYARTALLVWGGVSMAAVSGAALVYAHAGSEPESALHAIVLPSAAAAQAPAPGEPATAAAAETGAEIKAASETGMEPTVLAPSAPEPSAGAPARLVPSTKPLAVAALPVRPSIEAAAAEPLAEPPHEPVAEARLPRPRPDEALTDARIERQWRELRAARHAGYQPLRPRLYYRYGMAPL